MQKSRYYIRNSLILYIFLASFLFQGCKNVSVSQLYHDFNAKFNYLINARALYDKTLIGLQTKPDNYNNPEPIKIPSQPEALSMTEDPDKVIEKASFIIKKHPQSKFIEEAYMLVAKSNFYKLNLNNASSIFQYIYNNFDNKRVKQEAMSYDALSKMLMGQNELASESIDIALNITKDPKEINNIIYKASAQILANNNHFTKAAEQMDLASQYSGKNDKNEILRDKLIEAFYYKKANNNIASEKIYKEIIDNNTEPRSVINDAKLNYLMTLINNKSYAMDTERIILNEIDAKENANDYLFQSQLYYLLGTLHTKNNDYNAAIKYFTTSAKKAGENNLYQQAIANQAIGDLYYNNIKDFASATKYYDDALATGLTNLPKYNDLQTKKTNLNQINTQLEVIHQEDSLQNIAKLPLDAQDLITDSLANKLLQKKNDIDNNSEMQNAQQKTTTNFQNSGSGWYFYNNIAVSTAQTDFKRRWGNRELSDRWRYSLRSSGNTNNLTENILTTNIPEDIIYDKEKIKDLIFAQIPNSPEKLEESKNKEINAYIKLIGLLYNQLNENNEAIKYANKFLNKYPNSQRNDEIYYILTEAYSNINNSEQSNIYKDKLITNFPESEYTKVVIARYKKPENIKADTELLISYNRAFTQFTNKEFKTLIDEYYQNQNTNATIEAQAKYAFLCALAVGKLQTTNVFKQELINIENLYPKTSYSKESSTLIAYIDKNLNNVKNRLYAVDWSPNDKPNVVFDRLYYKEQQKLIEELNKIKNILKNSYFKKITDKDLLYTAIVVPKNLSLSEIRLNLRLFARNNLNKQLPINVKDLNDNKKILYIGPFHTLKEANDYHKKLKRNAQLILELDPKTYETFVITQPNLEMINNKTQINDYLTYYRLTDWLEKNDF